MKKFRQKLLFELPSALADGLFSNQIDGSSQKWWKYQSSEAAL